MHVSRSRLIAVAAVVLVVAGSALAAGSLAWGSSSRPAASGPPQQPPEPRPSVPPALPATGIAQRTFVSAASGNDANPCTRTAPCRNFQAAIAQTASGGEVIVLDSGGYGPVTISQAVSLIAPAGVYAGISVFSGTGITINAGSGDVVTIRGLTLNGLGGQDGIDFLSGARLYVEDGVFRNFANNGVDANLAASGSLVVEDSLFTGIGYRAVYLTTSSGTIQGTIEHSRFENGFIGVIANANSVVVIRDSVARGNAYPGFWAGVSTAQVDVENSLTTLNAWGLVSYGGMRVSQTTIEENTTGLLVTGGSTMASFGNNRLAGNGTDGSFSSTIPLQ